MKQIKNKVNKMKQIKVNKIKQIKRKVNKMQKINYKYKINKIKKKSLFMMRKVSTSIKIKTEEL